MDSRYSLVPLALNQTFVALDVHKPQRAAAPTTHCEHTIDKLEAATHTNVIHITVNKWPNETNCKRNKPKSKTKHDAQTPSLTLETGNIATVASTASNTESLRAASGNFTCPTSTTVLRRTFRRQLLDPNSACYSPLAGDKREATEQRSQWRTKGKRRLIRHIGASMPASPCKQHPSQPSSAAADSHRGEDGGVQRSHSVPCAQCPYCRRAGTTKQLDEMLTVQCHQELTGSRPSAGAKPGR